jgi:chromosome segregation ATPase
MFEALFYTWTALEQERADHAHTTRALDNIATVYSQELDQKDEQMAQLHDQFVHQVEFTKTWREKAYALELKLEAAQAQLEATQAVLAFTHEQLQDAQAAASNRY